MARISCDESTVEQKNSWIPPAWWWRKRCYIASRNIGMAYIKIICEKVYSLIEEEHLSLKNWIGKKKYGAVL